MSAVPSLIGFLAVSLSAGSSFAAEKLPRVPAGFTIEKVTTPDLVKHPMLAGFDDRGRLFVACSAGKNIKAKDLMKNPPNFIKLLEDTNGDGKFDKATVFADKMTLPMGALWYRGALYVASPPHIWKLEDTNDDGVADKRTILVNKFGFSGNAASVHGCFLGPTGRIYWCDGRHGHEFKDKSGKVVSQGKAARIFSCKPDGSDVRTHCGGGMDNPVEIDFTETGEMIGSVNILLGKPRQDCLMHWVEGGVYPRYDQQHCLDEFKRTGDLLQPMTKLGHVAVSGMMRYRSTHLGKKFQNNIFTTLFNTHKVIRSELKRSGSTFTTTEHEFLVSDNPDFHPTDVLEDADGSLLVIDTGGWFRIGCPVSKVAKPDVYGAIYRIRKTGAHKAPDPWGMKLGFAKMPAKAAVKYLDDPRWAVREKAIERLAVLDDKASRAMMDHYFRNSTSPAARRNLIWSHSRSDSYHAPPLIETALSDRVTDVRIAAACVLGQRAASLSSLVSTLESHFRNSRKCSVELRREMVRAMGEIVVNGVEKEDRGYKRAHVVLMQVLSASDVDRMLEHTAIYALIQISDRKATLPYLKHKSPTVRRAALIALDQMGNGKLTRELVTPLLDTDDPALQKTTLAIIAKHKGWAKETLSLLEKWLKEPLPMTEPGSVTPDRARKSRLSGRREIIRGFLIAQAADKNVQALVAKTLEAAMNDPAKQSLLLEVMDRASLETFPVSWSRAVRVALRSKIPSVKLQAVRMTGRHGLAWHADVEQIADDKTGPVELRAEALIALAPMPLFQIDDKSLRFLKTELKKDHPPLTKLVLARAIASSPLSKSQLVSLTKLLKTAGPLETPVLLRAFGKSKSATVGNALLAALATAKSKKSIPAQDLSRLLKNYPAEIQKKAEPLLKSLGVNPAERQKRVAALLKTTAGGDTARGKAVFFSKKAACASCHAIAGQGGKVGPDLSQIGKIRQPRDLVEAIAFPSASLARGFRSYTIVTDKGRIHTGVITRQTSTEIVIRNAELAEVRIPRKSVDIMRESPVSIMPKGMDKTLSAAELRDLLAYLRSRK